MKNNNQVPTTRQRKAARKLKEVIENNQNLEGNEILTIVGYSDAIAKNPKIVFESAGFKKALKELGFSIDAADLTIAKILRTGKEENQIKAAKEIYKRTGAYKSEPQGITNIFIKGFNFIVPNDRNNADIKTDS